MDGSPARRHCLHHTRLFIMLNSLYLATQTNLPERLKQMLWQAYGPIVKPLLIIVLVIFVGMPLLGFIKKILK